MPEKWFHRIIVVMAGLRRNKSLNWLRWDLRIVLAIIVGIGIVVALSWAAPTGSPLYVFDFGTSSTADLEPGAVHVMGGGSIYPKSFSGIQYGWVSGPAIQAISRGAAVGDKLLRDYNFSSGSSATFRMSGIPVGDYVARFSVGDNTNKIATTIKLQGRTASVVRTAEYGTADMPLTVSAEGATIDAVFSSAAVDAGWGINALQIFQSTTTAPAPSFSVNLNPTTQTVKAGGIAVYAVGVTPLNGYDGNVNLTLSGLPAGITAELEPAGVSDLPGSSTLRLSTQNTTAALPYEFLLTAKGDDSQAVTKSVVVRLTVTTPDGETPAEPSEPTGPISQVPGEEQTDAQRRAQFRLIDEYVAAEAENIVSKNNTQEIRGITEDFVAFPSAPQFPEPKTPVERSLQFMVKTGIIGSAVSNAPRGEEDDGPKSFFQRILNGIVSPLGG